MADDVMEVVRLGFPLNPLDAVSLDAVHEPPRKAFDAGWLQHLLADEGDDEDDDGGAEAVQGRVTTVPGKTTSLWFWFYVPGSGAGDFDAARLSFKYRQGSADWKTWSNASVSMGGGWWHTPNWIRGSGTQVRVRRARVLWQAAV
jgi:hypothetical protein